MLMDVLGTVIAFSAVMLLLSLLVTALVEATQTVAAFRALNLLDGVTDLLEAEGVKDPLRVARALLAGETTKRSWFRRLVPRMTAIGYDDLLARLARYAKTHEGFSVPAITREEFQHMEDRTSARFRRGVRLVSVAWAFVVAFYFQVDAPALLARMSNDPQARARAEQVGAELLAAPEVQAAVRDRSDTVNAAVDELGRRHPELSRSLEQVSGQAFDRRTMLAELRLIFRDQRADAEKLAGEYEAIVEHLEAPLQAPASKTEQQTTQLGTLDITPWRSGLSFYVKEGSVQGLSWIGVLVTTVLLTLGAPFWYERLRGLIGLRDTFAERAKAVASKAAPPDSG
jgi:hypothetical protein